MILLCLMNSMLQLWTRESFVLDQKPGNVIGTGLMKVHNFFDVSGSNLLFVCGNYFV